VSEPRNVKVALTVTEAQRVLSCIAGEAESLTDRDWESSDYGPSLDAAAGAIRRALHRMYRRERVRT